MPNSGLGNPVYQPNFSSCSALLSELLSLCWRFRKGSCLGLFQGTLVRFHASSPYKLHMALQKAKAPGLGNTGQSWD